MLGIMDWDDHGGDEWRLVPAQGLGGHVLDGVNVVITFELLLVITLFAKISTTVITAAKIAFRAKRSLVRF